MLGEGNADIEARVQHALIRRGELRIAQGNPE
jgi:hypothetical protein